MTFLSKLRDFAESAEVRATKLPYLEVFAGEHEGELLGESSPLENTYGRVTQTNLSAAQTSHNHAAVNSYDLSCNKRSRF